MTELKVNTGELRSGGQWLEEAANKIPEPLEPFTSTGTDALSTILATLTQEKEAPLITGLPATKAAAVRTAQKIQAAAGTYERSDQQIATDVTNATAGLQAAGGAGGSSVGGASQMQQMLSMPMQMAQQAGQMATQAVQSVGQLPQTVMQGVQGGVQQIGQMTGGMGQSGDGPESEKREDSAEDGAAPGSSSADRAPEAVPDAQPQKADPGIVL